MIDYVIIKIITYIILTWEKKFVVNIRKYKTHLQTKKNDFIYMTCMYVYVTKNIYLCTNIQKKMKMFNQIPYNIKIRWMCVRRGVRVGDWAGGGFGAGVGCTHIMYTTYLEKQDVYYIFIYVEDVNVETRELEWKIVHVYYEHLFMMDGWVWLVGSVEFLCIHGVYHARVYIYYILWREWWWWRSLSSSNLIIKKMKIKHG